MPGRFGLLTVPPKKPVASVRGYDVAARYAGDEFVALLPNTPLEGATEVRIEAGTQPGETITLRGEGMPRLRRRGRGDLKVVVDIMVPTRLSVEQRELLKRFEAASGEETYANGGGESFFDRLRSVFR